VTLLGVVDLRALVLARRRRRPEEFMRFHESALAAIGNTPLIKLKRASEETGCHIFGKAEFLNPGQSVKDRAALGIVRDAEERGQLQPGGVIVEGTAGNTGIGLALVGAILGYSVKIVMPRTQSQEKKDAVRLLGAELIEVDAVAYTNENHYVHFSRRLAEELARSEANGAIWANQFDNVANRETHCRTTGAEIWDQTDGAIDGFTCAVGTGGTLAGVTMALKERNPDVKCALTDPMGAKLFSWVKRGVLEAEGSSITEGIGQSRITANIAGVTFDDAYRIEDPEALEILFRLTKEEGLCLGGSAGVNIAGAIRLARDLGPGATIVTILCDHGNRYASKLYNPEFLRSKGLPVPSWMT
jgi:cysteine synthase A